MHMAFKQVINGQPFSPLKWFSGEFYEADIKTDAILSFPWMAENQVGIFPHHRALAMDTPCFTLLYGLAKNAKRKNPSPPGWSGGGRGGHRRHKKKGSRYYPRIQQVGIIREDLDEEFLQVQKMLLEVPQEGICTKSDFLSQEENELVFQNLKENPKGTQISIIEAHSTLTDDEEKAETFRKKIHDDYDGVVLRNEVPPDPPVRGMYGYAYIPLKDGAVPQRQKPFYQHGERHDAMKQITEDWLSKKFIERPRKGVEWLCQAFAVPKKSTTFPWRGVVDMRGVNSQTRKCNYPLPSIENILVRQGRNKLFSILDLRQAFHQQPMDPESRHLTCTYTPNGIFQWRVNVMGLMNASVQFQQMMDDRLERVQDIANAYIDDVLVGTWVEDGEDLMAAHDRDLRRVLDVLKAEQLIVDISKCKLFVPEVEFCGHIFGKGARRPAPGKLMALKSGRLPSTFPK